MFAVGGCRILLEKSTAGDRLRFIFHFLLLLKPFSAPSDVGGHSINHVAFAWRKCQVSNAPCVHTTRSANIPWSCLRSGSPLPPLPAPLILRSLSHVLLSLWFRVDWNFCLEHMLNTPRTAGGEGKVRWMFLDVEHASCGWMDGTAGTSQKRWNLYALWSAGYFKVAMRNIRNKVIKKADINRTSVCEAPVVLFDLR